MKKMSETIVFFGSGPVAARALRLLARDFQINAVVTKPRPPHHHGSWPVIDAAHDLHIDTMLVKNKKELSNLISEDPFSSRIGIVIDFGIIITQEVIDYFPLGIVNSHFSLLPRWRGADPITYSLLAGDTKTGVSLMLINDRLDEGILLAQRTIPITPHETNPSITEKLIFASHELLCDTLPQYVRGDIRPYPQDTTGTTYSHKLSKEDGVINWGKSATELEREVRAYVEWPKSSTMLSSIRVSITKARVVANPEHLRPGQLLIQGKSLIIGCGKDALAIERLKPAGKQEMSIEAFLAGYRHLL